MSRRSLWIAVAVVGLPACEGDYFTSLWYQPAVRPQSDPRPEPEHSVPLGGRPRLQDRDDAVDFKDPVPSTPESIARGRALFLERCAPCHGPEGHGMGPVAQVFPPAPDLRYSAIVARTDGYIFGTVVLGGKAMPPQSEGLTTREEWDLVNEVRAIQKTGGPVDGGQP